MQICEYVNLYIYVEFSVQEKQANMEWMKLCKPWKLIKDVIARKKQAKLLKKMSFTKQDSEETNSVITDGGSQVLNDHHSDHSDDHLWPLLITSDHFWPLLTTSDHFWSLLITSGHFWSHPTTSDHFWSLLATSDHFWSHLITSDHFWSLLITSDCLCEPSN